MALKDLFALSAMLLVTGSGEPVLIEDFAWRLRPELIHSHSHIQYLREHAHCLSGISRDFTGLSRAGFDPPWLSGIHSSGSIQPIAVHAVGLATPQTGSTANLVSFTGPRGSTIMYDVHDQSMEPTVLGAAWQYRWLVLFLAIGFAGLGWLYGNSNEAWTATATITVEDPRTSGVFEQVFADTPERYVTNQAEIAGSRTVLKRSIDLLAAGNPPIEIDIEDLVDEIGVSADGASDEIDIVYTGATSAEAIAVVNAVADAYQDVALSLIHISEPTRL